MLIKKYGHEYDNARESYHALIENNNLHEREVCKLEEFIHQFEHYDKTVLEYDYDLMKRTKANYIKCGFVVTEIFKMKCLTLRYLNVVKWK